MFRLNLFLLVIISIIIQENQAVDTPAQYQANINFYCFSSNGTQFNCPITNDAAMTTNCNVAKNITIVTHGLGENLTNRAWPLQVIGNFTVQRGGCVIFMDYYHYSQMAYLVLFGNFDGIRTVHTNKLLQVARLGWNPKNIQAFGFSFGSQVVFESLYQFSLTTGVKISKAYCCEPAAPEFDATFFNPTYKSVLHAKSCADLVECIHTDCGDGTCNQYCDHDFLMGNCGISQAGSAAPPLGSHGMCPYMFANAFILDYPLVVQPSNCAKPNGPNVVQDITKLAPYTSVMGFRFNTSFPFGIYFALTGPFYPWTE